MLKEHFIHHQKEIAALARCTEAELELYERHFVLLKNWNERMALVSKKSIDRSFASHYLDSIYIADYTEKLRDGREVFDLGTGAGFPGVIYAIRYPETQVALFERSLKKQTFLSAVLASLQLNNLSSNGDFFSERRSGVFLARAVLPPAELFRFMSTRMHVGSTLIVNVGGQSPSLEVIKEFRKTGELTYDLPMDAGSRRVESFDFVPRGTN